jgi:hypothetical protein
MARRVHESSLKGRFVYLQAGTFADAWLVAAGLQPGALSSRRHKELITTHAAVAQ